MGSSSRSMAGRSSSPIPTSRISRSEVKLSKLDIVRYYLAVAPGALAGIRDRPVVLKRFVDGAEGEPFYQKRAPAKRPDWLRTVTLSFPSGRTAEEVVVDDAAGLAWIVNLGCIELHPHPVRTGDLDHPDELRIDLDPDARRRVGGDPPRRAGGEGAARGAWPARLAEDQRLARHARQRPHPAALDLHRGAAGRAGPVARDRAAHADARDLEMVEGGTARRVPRLQPERQGPHHLLGLFGPAAARCARLGAARLGRGAGLRACRLHRAHHARALRRDRRSASRGWTTAAGSLEALLELAARDEAAGLGDAPWPPHFRKMEGEPPRVAPSRAKRPGKAPRVRMPLIVIANSPDREAALAGLERWKQRHPEAARHLAVDDVLVDNMRGRSSTWTRIRLNLRNVPPELRPAEATPDPDDDPTRPFRGHRARASQPLIVLTSLPAPHLRISDTLFVHPIAHSPAACHHAPALPNAYLSLLEAVTRFSVCRGESR